MFLGGLLFINDFGVFWGSFEGYLSASLCCFCIILFVFVSFFVSGWLCLGL